MPLWSMGILIDCIQKEIEEDERWGKPDATVWLEEFHRAEEGKRKEYHDPKFTTHHHLAFFFYSTIEACCGASCP